MAGCVLQIEYAHEREVNCGKRGMADVVACMGAYAELIGISYRMPQSGPGKIVGAN
jgi:hypothetical protein